MNKKAIVIGSGFAGLSAACYLAKDGYKVTVLEKNNDVGGRARVWRKNGFTFDLGPSWYWMPDVFEKFFADFGHKISDYYDLKLLDPGFRIWFGENSKLDDSFRSKEFKTGHPFIDIPADEESFYQLCEKIEPGCRSNLENLLRHASYTYKNGVNDYMERPAISLLEFVDFTFIKGILASGLLKSYGAEIDKLFKTKEMRDLLKFPTLFLGATPEKTAYLYSLMLHAAIVGKTWYPMGGMSKIIEGMISLAKELGVEVVINSEVENINVENNKVISVSTKDTVYQTDYVVAAGDYAHIEQNLLEKRYHIYTEKYWNSRTLAPSSLIFYWGIKGEVKNFVHHNLFFDENFEDHANQIYTYAEWPQKPLFYVSNPSKTDPSIVPHDNKSDKETPNDYENLFVLIPIAPDLEDNEETRGLYRKIVLDRIEKITGQKLHDKIILERSYCVNDFKDDYHALKGNAYGLANTLLQTAIFKPKLAHPKISNLVFAGQLTVPGPGMPPSLISGKLAANYIKKHD